MKSRGLPEISFAFFGACFIVGDKLKVTFFFSIADVERA
jgi:hypothetical protein